MGTTRDLVENERKIITDKAAVEGDVIGVNQAWQDVKSSRALDVTYANTTGKPIELAVSTFSTSSNVALRIFVNGIKILNIQSPANLDSALSALVPDGATYRVETSAASTIDVWAELR